MKLTTQEWINRAKDDLDVIEEIQDIEHLTNMVAFHAQQAIEKSLKAILEEHDEDIPRIHDLVRWMVKTTPFMDSTIARLDDILGYGKPDKKDKWWFDLEDIDGTIQTRH